MYPFGNAKQKAQTCNQNPLSKYVKDQAPQAIKVNDLLQHRERKENM